MDWFNFGKADKVVDSVGNAVTGTIDSLNYALSGDLPPEIRARLEETKFRMKSLDNAIQTKVIEVVAIDAKSSSRFQSWWRPMIGWICGISIAMYFIPQYAMGAYIWLDIINSMTHTEIIKLGLPAYPVKPDALLELVFAMLGFGLYRSIDKRLGTAK
jgi:hypothetical protein